MWPTFDILLLSVVVRSAILYQFTTLVVLNYRNMFEVFIMLNGRDKILLTVDEKWTVLELKKAIVAKLGSGPAEARPTQTPKIDSVGPLNEVSHETFHLGLGLDLNKHNSIKVIFAGVELLNSLNIKDCEIPDGSMIHIVVDVKTDEAQRDDHNRPAYSSLLSRLSDLEAATSFNEDLRKKPCFYVFCKEPCSRVTQGKLRVCCQKCKQGAFTVLQDVTCWEDVLTPGKIQGCCQLDGCNGDKSEFYFKCANHQGSEGGRVPALHLVKTNTREIPCLTCDHVYDPVLVFSCESSHVICLECFKLYCHTKLNERQFIQHNEIGYSLPCPVGCENSLIEETHHFRVLGHDEYNKYQSFATEECVLQNGGVLCPAPGCGSAIFVDEDIRRLKCIQHGDIGCGFVFCRSCRLSYHDGVCTNNENIPSQVDGYLVDLARAERARWDNASRTTIHATTKPCPNCKAPVEKNGGCMHMQCPRVNCRYGWCWLCGVAWNNDCMALHWFGEEPFFL
ncbi:E3 ubiquitin-protein ligase parkin-like [Antedon mediterranea]|uniref:E3 ubiquitin-protein ligase parkin-like n=1 Tax=Antedon mediterranea TaxID=105859 RepID=UPI003AF57A18